jgi:uncharacterized protein YdeI (YjbR/CyaY-like superfamily)
MTGVEIAPDGKPVVGPFDREGWRAWLRANHLTATGVYLASWRRGSGRTSVSYGEAVEEALCVGWVDATQRTLDEDRSIQWYAPRRPGSGWARSNKERVERLMASGLMLPAGLAAVDEARRRGTWTLFDAVEDLVVPDDLAAAFATYPGSAATWDAFSPSARRAILGWIVQARRPATRARRLDETARLAARGEKANQWVPPAERDPD